MKFLKRGTAILISSILAFNIVACGGSGSGSGSASGINYSVKLTAEQEIEKYGEDAVNEVNALYDTWSDEEKEKQWHQSAIQIPEIMEAIEKMEAEIDDHEEHKENLKKFKSLMERVSEAFKGAYAPEKLRNVMLDTAALMKEVGTDFMAFYSGY